MDELKAQRGGVEVGDRFLALVEVTGVARGIHATVKLVNASSSGCLDSTRYLFGPNRRVKKKTIKVGDLLYFKVQPRGTWEVMALTSHNGFNLVYIVSIDQPMTTLALKLDRLSDRKSLNWGEFTIGGD